MKRDLEQEMRDRGPDGRREIDATIKIKLLRPGAKMPMRATDGAAGWDVFACIDPSMKLLPDNEPVLQHTSGGLALLRAGDWVAIPLGFAIEMQPGWEMQLRPRSGLAMSEGVMGYFGTIDSDYRGECAMLLFAAHMSTGLSIYHGARMGQAIFARVPTVELVEVEELTPSARGRGGFGSTGR